MILFSRISHIYFIYLVKQTKFYPNKYHPCMLILCHYKDCFAKFFLCRFGVSMIISSIFKSGTCAKLCVRMEIVFLFLRCAIYISLGCQRQRYIAFIWKSNAFVLFWNVSKWFYDISFVHLYEVKEMVAMPVIKPRCHWKSLNFLMYVVRCRCEEEINDVLITHS